MKKTIRYVAAPLVLLAPLMLWRALPSSEAVPAGWTEVWSDQFSGPAGAGLDSAKWIPQLGTSYPGGAPHWGTGQVETETNNPENVSTDGQGHARIAAVRASDGSWTSARLETVRTDFQPPPGGQLRVEFSAKEPDVTGAEAAGIWPALWMLGGPARPVGATNWPGVGEADILETAGGHDSNWATLHCGTWGGVCNEPDGKSSGEVTAASLGLSSFKTSFHTFAVEWDMSTTPQEMRWYIDGVLYHTVRADQMPADVWTQATSHGYFLVMDIAVGGGLADKAGGGPTPATKSGVPMLVDYVTVSQKGGSSTPTGTPTTTSPTSTGSPTSPTSPTSTSTTPTGPSGTATVTVTSTVTSTVTVTSTDCPPSPTSTSPSPTTTATSGSPGSPSNLRLAGSTPSSLSLQWDGTPTATYDILRAGVRIATVTGTTFTDAGLNPRTSYIYSIRGVTTTPQQTYVTPS